LIETSVEELKDMKTNYLQAKVSAQSLRDQYIDSTQKEVGLKQKRNIKKLKVN
jgi:hypothetical protein